MGEGLLAVRAVVAFLRRVVLVIDARFDHQHVGAGAEGEDGEEGPDFDRLAALRAAGDGSVEWRR